MPNHLFPKCASAALFTICLAVTIVFAGCASHDGGKNRLSEDVFAPKPPEFIVGAASALLTNGTAFSARVSVAKPGATEKANRLNGQLLGQGNHLIFSPSKGDRTVIWDSRARTGFILSEALQGYAPFSSAVEVTNIATVSETAGPSSARVNGHPGHEVEISIAMDDGSMPHFKIWRASDINGFPVRITAADNSFQVDFFEVAPAKITPDLFLPPDSFTRYSNPDAMAGELFARKSKPKRTDSTYFGEAKPVLREQTP